MGISPCAPTLTSKMFASFLSSPFASTPASSPIEEESKQEVIQEPVEVESTPILPVTPSSAPLPQAEATSSSAPVEAKVVREAPKPVVTDANPYTFRPTHGFTSHHLQFLVPDVSLFTTLIKTVTALLALNPANEAIIEAGQVLIQKAESEKTKVVAETKIKNARLLAERVIHKFRKWGPVRFGLKPDCRRDFYNGTSALDTLDNPVKFDSVFEGEIRKQCVAAGVDADLLLPHIHLGAVSIVRFKEFMTLTTEVKLTRDCFCGMCSTGSPIPQRRAMSDSFAQAIMSQPLGFPMPLSKDQPDDEDDYDDDDDEEDDLPDLEDEAPASGPEPAVKVEDDMMQE